jgi:MFS family permease
MSLPKDQPQPGTAYWSLIGASFISSVGLGVYIPVLSLFARSLGATAAMAGLLLSAAGASRMIITVPGAYLAERFGRRPVIAASGIMRGILSIVISTCTTFPPLLVLFGVLSAGWAVRYVCILSAVAEMSGSERRGRSISTLQAGDLIGYSLGPAVGGLLAQRFGLNAPFVALGVLEIISACVVLVLFREPSALRHSNGRPSFAAVAAALRNPSFRAIAIVGLSQLVVRSGAYSVISPLYAAARLSLPQAQIGTAMTMSAVAIVLALQFAGRILDRGHRDWLVLGYTALMPLSLFCISQSRSLYAFGAAQFMQGFSAGIIMPVPPSYVAETSRDGSIAVAMGSLQTVSELGSIIGPVALGYIADVTGGNYSVSFWAAAALVYAAGSSALGEMRRQRLGTAARA